VVFQGMARLGKARLGSAGRGTPEVYFCTLRGFFRLTARFGLRRIKPNEGEILPQNQRLETVRLFSIRPQAEETLFCFTLRVKYAFCIFGLLNF
jgi:hypothetical protein